MIISGAIFTAEQVLFDTRNTFCCDGTFPLVKDLNTEYFHLVSTHSVHSHGSPATESLLFEDLWSKVCLLGARGGSTAPDFTINWFWQLINLLRKFYSTSSGTLTHTRSESNFYITFNVQNKG